MQEGPLADQRASRHNLCCCRCNIQWMEGWDADGMQAVAIARLQPILNDAEKDASKLVQQAVVLHSSCLSTGATPRHYVAFVSLCSSIYTKKRSQLLQQQNFLKVHVGLLLHSLPHLVPACLLLWP